jgi:hypothetical protein
MHPMPDRGTSFHLVDRAIDLDTGHATFRYDLDGIALVEQVRVPVGAQRPRPAVLDLLLDVAHVALGTSYFKLRAPRQLRFERPVSTEVIDLARQVYDEGMREFAVVNHLPVPLDTEIAATPSAPIGPEPIDGHGCDRPLLPIGGGKDSAAVLTLLEGRDVTAVAVTPTPAQRRLTSAAGVPLLEVTRTLDPKLAALTAEGGMNGHIPITAVNSALSVLVAALGGHDCVIFGNERSANEPTRTVAGVPVNHQHSKSFAFEEDFAHAVAPSGVSYFSLLRRLSGLSVAGIVAAAPRLRGEFLSCNRAFTRSRRADDPQVWCLECPKCLSTVLAFAPFLSVDEAAATFGGNPLDDTALVDGFRALWDVEAKPFECVAEMAESAAAMAWLATADGWREQAVVVALGDEAARAAGDLHASMDALLRPQGSHLVPDDLASLVETRAAEVRLRR